MVGKRSSGGKSGGAHERVLATFLNEMDGVGVRTDSVLRENNEQKVLKLTVDKQPHTSHCSDMVIYIHTSSL